MKLGGVIGDLCSIYFLGLYKWSYGWNGQTYYVPYCSKGKIDCETVSPLTLDSFGWRWHVNVIY